MLLKEFCAENMERVPDAIDAGAKRIELCDNLACGGTSPSVGVVRAASRLCREHGVTLMAMVRPRGGDFAYSAGELRMMDDDIVSHACSGVDGVVFGCALDGRLDVDAMEHLLSTVRSCAGASLEVTFHMAFDEISPDEQLVAIDWFAAHGVTRILTHGGPAGTSIGENLPRLRAYVERAAGRIGILPGGGPRCLRGPRHEGGPPLASEASWCVRLILSRRCRTRPSGARMSRRTWLSGARTERGAPPVVRGSALVFSTRWAYEPGSV